MLTAVGAATPEPPLLYLLAEAAAWCLPRTRRADPAGCLRSADLQPSESSPVSPEAVRQVALARRELLPHPLPLRPLPVGRLLCCRPTEISEAEALVEASEGYFTRRGEPPWDTWIAVVPLPDPDSGRGPFLLAYVPQQLQRLVAKALTKAPQAGLEWWAGDPTQWPDEYPEDIA